MAYDWIVIPTLDTEPRPVDLPNKDMYKEKGKENLKYIQPNQK